MRTAFRRTSVPVLLLALPTSGCYHWGGAPAPGPGGAQRVPNPVRITRADGSIVILHDAFVSNDSIVGYFGDSPDRRQRAAVAVAQVRRVEGREIDVLMTTATSTLVTLTVLVVAGIAILAVAFGGT